MYNEARTLRQLGGVYTSLDDDDTAIRLLEQSLDRFRQLHVPYQEGSTLRTLAPVVARARGPRAARRYWQAAYEFRDLLNPRFLDELRAGLEGRPPPPTPGEAAEAEDPDERAGATV
jgi:hypothetical protein